ncbi:MAG: hypothetical protein FJ272_20220, partial [Planctomycetes bacterium]|nr:hypothetical protein [Planctomycetota bacterium]
ERLTLCSDRLESVWPVSASVLAHNGLIYAVAGRNSYLDGGLLLYALDPSTGAVKHHRRLDGPWPDREALRKGVAIEGDKKLIQTQHATGYDLDGAQADLLVTDGTDLYLMKHKFTPALSPIPMQRVFHTGLTPMGGKHLLANFGFLDDTMFHRSYWMYDEVWPGYGGGSGWAARAGTMVVVGAQRAYAAKHYEGGWYPTHRPGSGARPAIWQRGGDRAHGGAALGDDRAADRPGHAGRAGRAGRGTRVHRRHRRGQHASRVGQVHRVRRPRQTARPQRRRRPGPRRLRPARLPGLRRHERRRRQDADRVGERPSHLHERKEPLMKKSIIVAAICLLAMALSPRVRAVEPADPNLMPEARRLLDYIVSVQGKGIITGMERTGGGQGPFPAVLHVSGREPAIYGTDIYGYHTKFNETYHGVVKAVVAKSLQWWQDKGGIVEIHYHWGKPTDPNGSAWKNKPKGAKLLDLAKTLTPGTDEYKAFHSDLSVTADYLKQLADAKVPVLWRPFHEIDGGWFWWTDPEKPENTAALYRQMFRYLVKERGLHNLIWVYNAAHVTRSSQKPKDAAFA